MSQILVSLAAMEGFWKTPKRYGRNLRQYLFRDEKTSKIMAARLCMLGSVFLFVRAIQFLKILKATRGVNNSFQYTL